MVPLKAPVGSLLSPAHGFFIRWFHSLGRVRMKRRKLKTNIDSTFKAAFLSKPYQYKYYIINSKCFFSNESLAIVILLDGKSEAGAPVRSNLCILICLRLFDQIP